MPCFRTCLARGARCNTMSHLTAAGCSSGHLTGRKATSTPTRVEVVRSLEEKKGQREFLTWPSVGAAWVPKLAGRQGSSRSVAAANRASTIPSLTIKSLLESNPATSRFLACELTVPRQTVTTSWRPECSETSVYGSEGSIDYICMCV